MKELNRTRRLTIAAVVFVAIILVGLLSLRRPDIEYQLSQDEMMDLVLSGTHTITTEEARSLIERKNPEYVFIDLRSENIFERGTLPGAINIPVSDILEPRNLEFFKTTEGDSVQVILFAEDQQEANGPWMLLRQIGIENVKVLMGGYESMTVTLSNRSDTGHFLPEEPILNYAEFMEKLGMTPTTQEDSQPIQIQTVLRKKKTVVEGGC
jgi:rhodanese-related sulfurtransferase